MILLSSQVNSEEPRNIPQAHWKQDTSIRAKSVPVPLGLLYIITTRHSLELINITILTNYKYLMSCLPQLRFILKRAFSLIGKTVSPHFLVSLKTSAPPSSPSFWTKKLSWMDEASGWLWGPCRLLLFLCDPMNKPTAGHDFTFLWASHWWHHHHTPDHITGHFLPTCHWPWGHLKRLFPLRRVYKLSHFPSGCLHFTWLPINPVSGKTFGKSLRLHLLLQLPQPSQSHRLRKGTLHYIMTQFI